MAGIKPAELRDVPTDELIVKLTDAREELFNLRFQLGTGQLDNYRQVRTLRKDVARIATVIRERELGISREGDLERSEATPEPKPAVEAEPIEETEEQEQQ